MGPLAAWDPGAAPSRLTDFADRINESVVTVYCQDGLGSGWSAAVNLIEEHEDLGYKSYVITNFHVIEECVYEGTRDIEIRRDGVSYPAFVHTWNEENDLGALLTTAELPPLSWDGNPRPRIGQWVAAFGSPFGLTGSMTTGSVSYVEDNALTSTAPINPGNSGGPLVDNLGRVVGINTATIIGGNSVGIVQGAPQLCVEIFDCDPAGPAVWLDGDTPGAPVGVTARQTKRGVSVTWTAPQDDGGQPILAYFVTARPGGAMCVSTKTSCQFTGLAFGRSYTFTVQSSNGIGPGEISSPSSALRLVEPAPGKVVDLRATPVAGGLKVTWKAPSTRGVRVTAYHYQVGSGPWQKTTTRTLTLTGLIRGQEVTVRVRAEGKGGMGAIATVRAAPR